MLGKKFKQSPSPEVSTGKAKKPFFKKWWFWCLIILFVIGAFSGGGHEKTPSESDSTPASSQRSPVSVPSESAAPEKAVIEKEPEVPDETPDIEVSNDFEAFIWKTAKAHDSELTDIDTIDPSETSEETAMIGTMRCPNDEKVIIEILAAISEEIKRTPDRDSVMLAISDIKDKDDTCIATAYVSADGTSDIVSMSIDYNNARNQWIKAQFSAWDGSHTALKNLVVKQLNDEKSFDHIKTTYRDISDETAQAEVNKILTDAGYSQRVEVGDLFIQMEFSAKNAFNATVKNTAFGIASFNKDTITLIDIG